MGAPRYQPLRPEEARLTDFRAGATLRAMRRMFVQVPMQTGYGQITRVEVALPYVAALIQDGGKYYMEPKSLEGTEKRRYRHRGPTLRSLVKLAVACDSAEEMGKKLKRRFDRSCQRQGIAPPGRAANREFDSQIDRIIREP